MNSCRIGDYNVLKVEFPNDTTSDPHSLYCKLHKYHNEKQDLPNDRTLFVAGLPFYINRDSIADVFSSLGAISSLHLCSSPGASKVIATKAEKDPYLSLILTDIDNFLYAYVVFQNILSIELVRKLCKQSKDSPLICEHVKQVGVSSWIKEYIEERPDIKVLETQVKGFMTRFDARRQLEDSKTKKRKNLPDEDGWITVTGRNNRKIPKSKISKFKQKKVDRKKRKNELLHFYKFQMREEKRDAVLQLQKKFDEDKKKLAAMKLNRKFKPL